MISKTARCIAFLRGRSFGLFFDPPAVFFVRVALVRDDDFWTAFFLADDDLTEILRLRVVLALALPFLRTDCFTALFFVATRLRATWVVDFFFFFEEVVLVRGMLDYIINDAIVVFDRVFLKLPQYSLPDQPD